MSLGQYWRFQENGHSAVSTIEALAYTAVAAHRVLHTPVTATATDTVIDTSVTTSITTFTGGTADSHETAATADSKAAEAEVDNLFNTLLTLFRLQKYRVLTRVFVEGGRAPKAIRVTGVGLGSWLPLTSQFMTQS